MSICATSPSGLEFNVVYEELLPHPFPVRTAVQTGLLSDFKVEIEMWAAKDS